MSTTNFRGETLDEARKQIVYALRSSKSWVGAYAEAYVDDFAEMSVAAAQCGVCHLPRAVAGVAGDSRKHCACARMVMRQKEVSGNNGDLEDWIIDRTTDQAPQCCPECDQVGTVAVRYSSTVVPVSGDPGFTAHNLEGDYCPTCKEVFICSEKIRRNDTRYNAARSAAGKIAS